MAAIKQYIVIGILALFASIAGNPAIAKMLEVGEGYPYISIQDAITDAVSGDVVLVHDGTYFEKINFKGKAIILRSEHGAAVTIIDAKGPGHVVSFKTSEGAGSVLNGFTIKDRSASIGSGIYCHNSSPTIINCIISGNSSECGGGIYCYNSSPSITYCTIKNNHVSGNPSNPTRDGGGGIFLLLSSPNISNCTIFENTAHDEDRPGQVAGGGIFCSFSSSPVITNCEISGNSTANGGGIYCESSSPIIINCTIAGNWALNKGSEIYCTNSVPEVINSIIWSNVADDVMEIYLREDSLFIDISNSDVKQTSGVYPGAGNINLNPLFANPENKDYHLQPGSPCVDAIVNVNVPDNDRDGLSRPQDGDKNGVAKGDMGAYELTRQKHIGPGESIQEAINAAWNGDVIIVSQGTYTEIINFSGKAITLKSSDPDDPNVVAATIIDGADEGSVVGFDHGEGSGSVLSGFTLQNGKAINGGGIYCDGSSPEITNCFIINNSAHYGGGIYGDHSMCMINNCNINGNKAYNGGGGIYCDNSSPTIAGCILSGNRASYGGGISLRWYSAPAIINCLITGNESDSSAGLSCVSSSPVITNCTISSNTANVKYGGISCLDDSSPIIKNSILWGNMARETSGEIYLGNYSSITTSYSNIQQTSGVYPGTGNINADPLFGGREQGNFYLLAGSPCIDKGISASAPSEDQEGIPRPQGAGIDLGAYEYINPDSCIPRALFTAKPATGNDPLPVYFDASSSGGSQYEGTTFSWDFGDGTKGTGMKVYHTYANCGSYNVILTINTQCGAHRTTLYDLIKIKSAHVTKQVGVGHPYTSIQDAINNAVYGEIILVHDGTYAENIKFSSRQIIVRSENGADTTIISGDGSKAIVSFGQSQSTVLEGFTIQGSMYNNYPGVSCNKASPTINNCIISNSRYGVSCSNASPTINNCIIISNTASGVCCYYHSSPEINRCTIKNNSTLEDYVYFDDYYPPGSYPFGSGIYCSESSPKITNCTISGNKASYGGGIQCYKSSPTIINCSISDNKAFFDGGGIYCVGSSPAIINSILWGDASNIYSDNAPNEIHLHWDSFITVTYSDIQQASGVYPGASNMNIEPLFINPNTGDYHLRTGSPCIDTGNNVNAPDNDRDGLSLPQDGDNDGDAVWDMGAYEFAGQEVHVFCGGSIQAAINAVNDGAVIIVHQGTYIGAINFLGKAVTVKSIDPGDPNVVAATIIDGADEGSVVGFDHGEGSGSVLIGFTLQNGKAINGGGIYCNGSSPWIANCNICSNTASLGGGIYCEFSSSPMIAYCVIGKNTTTQDGGGIYCCHNSLPIVINSVLLDNKVEEIPNGICLENDFIAYSDIHLLGNINENRIHIQRYNQYIGRWEPAYMFFGKSCGMRSPIETGQALFISLLPE